MPTGHNDVCARENVKVRNSELLYETSFGKGYHLMVIADLLLMVINGFLYI